MKRRFMKNLNTVSRCASLYRDMHLADCGLSGYQTSYVFELCAQPGITQDELAGKIHVNRSSVTRQLALLEQNGFITRERCENDRRAMMVYPTEKMHSALPRVQKAAADWYTALTEGLTDDELAALQALMQRLAKRAEELV